MVAPQGFEPRLPDPESDVLPLDQGAKPNSKVYFQFQITHLNNFYTTTSNIFRKRRRHVSFPKTAINSNKPGPNPTPQSPNRVG